MVERLGSAVLELRTDDSKFTKGVKGAKTAAGKLDKNLKKATKSSGKLGKALAKVGTRVKGLAKGLVSMRSAVVLAAGIVGLGLLVKKALNTADKIGKMADAIGISTDALQEYRHAAELSGIATGALDKALLTATKNVGELGRSSSELSTALKDLDPTLLANIRSASSMSEAFDLAFVAMSGYEKQSKRVAVSNVIFGRSGKVMTNIVRDGADAFREMIREARTLGLIIPESLIRGAEDANDALTRLTSVMKAQATVIFTSLSPHIIALSNAFLELVPSAIAALDSFLPEEFAGLDELIRRLESLREMRRELMSDMTAGEAIIERSFGLRAKEAAAIDKEIIAIENLIEVRRRAKEEILIDRGFVKALRAVPLGGFPSPRDMKEFERAMKKRISLQQRAQRAVADTRTAQEELNEAVVNYDELLSLGLINLETHTRAIEMAQETFNDTLEEGISLFEKLEEAGETAFDNLSDALIEFGATGKFEWRDLARVALTAIRDIISAYTQKGNFGSIFASAVTSIFGLFGGGGSTSRQIPIRPPPRRLGGSAAAGQRLLVGEGGREMFEPSVAGRILSNRDTEKAMGRGGDTYIIDATGADAEGMQRLESLIVTIDGSIERRSVAAVINENRRQPRMLG